VGGIAHLYRNREKVSHKVAHGDLLLDSKQLK
jgi:hypothetical protein